MSDKTVVWVANRNTPLSNSSGTFKIGDHGNVVVVDQVGNISWSSNETKAGQHVVQLLDSGNLVVKEMNESDPGKYLWQSFDYPTDTLLPDMKSWRSSADPSTGDYSFKLDFRGFPEISCVTNKK